MPDLEQALQAETKKERVYIADSWDEMAGWMGSSPDVLKGTINEYNAGCDSGNDLFCKDKRFLSPLRNPPYYGIKSTLNLLVTHGVIKTNKRMEVYDDVFAPTLSR